MILKQYIIPQMVEINVGGCSYCVTGSANGENILDDVGSISDLEDEEIIINGKYRDNDFIWNNGLW